MKNHLITPLDLRPVGRRVLNGAFVLGLLLALWGCAGERAPESSFVLLDGSTVSTKQLQGKVTLVNFWATSCTTCVAEMPQLIATYKQYQAQGFETVAVAMRRPTAKRKTVFWAAPTIVQSGRTASVTLW